MLSRKRFGQHFLQDQAVIDRIIAAISPRVGENLVEIGPGLGALTSKLLSLTETLTAIELDRDLIPKLEKLVKNRGKLHLYQADALRFDYSILATQQKIRVVGNLPYNISTPLLFHLLDYQTYIQDMHFMLQKEVAERIAAKPGTHSYGQLSVMVQYHCNTQVLFFIGPQAFSPPPQVESAFMRIIPRTPLLPAHDLTKLRTVVRQAFSQRRKMLHNSLKELMSAETLVSIGLDLKSRPEQLTVDDFVKISNIL